VVAALALVVAITWTEPRKVSDGVNSSRPATNAARGLGSATSRETSPCCGLAGSGGGAFRTQVNAAAASARMPSPSRSPSRGACRCGSCSPANRITSSAVTTVTTVTITAPMR